MNWKKWKIVVIILSLLIFLILTVYSYIKFVRVPEEVLKLEADAVQYFHEENIKESYEKLQKAEFVVVLDPVNGGTSAGKRSAYLKEQDIALEISKLVAELNQNDKIAIILSRTRDLAVSRECREDIIEKMRPDLLIQIGMNHKNKKELHGTSVYYPVDYYNHTYTNQEFADDLERAVVTKIEGMAAGIFEMAADESSILMGRNIPAVRLNCGNLNNELEKEMFEKQLFQENVAKGILNGIEEAMAVLEEE